MTRAVDADTRPLRLMLLGPANSIHLRRWAAGLTGRGHAVCVVSQHPCDAALLPAEVERVWLPARGGAGYATNAPAVRRLAARWRPDVVNVHYASGYGTLAALSRVRPTLLSVWGSDVYAFPHQGWLQGRLLRWNLRRADAIASTSRAMAAEVRRLTPERAEVAVTPFGVDLAVFSPRAENVPGGVITVGMLKSLAPVYGVDLLLQAFAGLLADGEVTVDCRLLIVGDGPQRAELVALAGRLGLADRVRFAGAVPHAEVPAWLRRFDLCVAPSRQESFGVAVVEASACGLPVVVSDAGGLPEVVQDGHTGLIVPVGDVPRLQAALKALVMDAGLRTRLGRQGRAFVSREYAWPACLDRMEAALRQVLRPASSPSAPPHPPQAPKTTR
jgi:glycosyltransferase involved in cell wall biosynthesis